MMVVIYAYLFHSDCKSTVNYRDMQKFSFLFSDKRMVPKGTVLFGTILGGQKEPSPLAPFCSLIKKV